MVLRAKTKTLFSGKSLTEKQRNNSDLNMREIDEKNTVLRSYPRRLVLELTNACNLNCIMCGRNAADFKLTSFDMDIFRSLEPLMDTFLISYGDCLLDISLEKLQEAHKTEAKPITAVVAKPSGRKRPLHFMEEEAEWKSSDKAWASAGIFMAGKEAFAGEGCMGDIKDMLSQSSTAVYRYEGFFNTIETLRDKAAAEEMWNKGTAPWMGII